MIIVPQERGLIVPPTPTGPSPVVGLKSTSGFSYFVDGNGNPKFLLYDNPWGIIANAGKFSGSGGGTVNGDIDNFCTARGAQGFTGAYFSPFSNATFGTFAYGNTWDHVPPFANGTATTPGKPDSGFNNAFWTRVDRLVNGLAAQGMTSIINIAYTEGGGGDIDGTAGCLAGLTTAQYQAFANNLVARYGSTPSIIWVMGNDYNFAGAPFDNSDGPMQTIYNQLRAQSDTHLFAFHPYPESDSRLDFGTGTTGETPDAWGPTTTQYEMVYTYIQTYFGIEFAYKESSPIPVIWGDGFFYGGAAPDIGMRQMFWWAVASGARGCISGSDAIWPWTQTAPANVTQGLWYTKYAGVAMTLINSLPKWWLLLPDVNNTLITAGRGTRTTATQSQGPGRQYGTAITDNYIAASYVPDGSLALIYFSGGTSGSTITINQGVMHAGYSAKRYDPTNGAVTNLTPGPTYSNPGANAAGDHDWVLVLQ